MSSGDEFEEWGDQRLAEYVSAESLEHSGASLAELNKQPIGEPSTFRSYLVERWERAWCKPLNQLTLSEVRVLLGQKDGLPWLARAVAEFVSKHPDADVEFYPGALTMAALRLFEQFKDADEDAAKQLADADLSWMTDCYSFDRSLQREAEQLIRSVKRSNRRTVL